MFGKINTSSPMLTTIEVGSPLRFDELQSIQVNGYNFGDKFLDYFTDLFRGLNLAQAKSEFAAFVDTLNTLNSPVSDKHTQDYHSQLKHALDSFQNMRDLALLQASEVSFIIRVVNNDAQNAVKFQFEILTHVGMDCLQLDSVVYPACGGGVDLSTFNLAGADLRGADLRGANLRGANLKGADMRKADLRKADLRGADIREADLRKANLRGGDLREADMTHANMYMVDMAHTNLRGATMMDSIMIDVNLEWADMERANMAHANMSYANISRANMAYVNLMYANLWMVYTSGIEYNNMINMKLKHCNLVLTIKNRSLHAPVHDSLVNASQ